MKLGYLANGERGHVCLKRLIDAGHDIRVVVVQGSVSDEAKTNPISSLASRNNIPVLGTDDINSADMISKIAAYECILMVLVGFNQILKKEVLNITPMGCINLHGGSLPGYRGGSPINWQIINGEMSGECIIHFVNEGIDTGDILARQSYPIEPDDNAGEVIARTLEIFPTLLLETLARLRAGNLKAERQDPLAGNYYCKRYPQDGRILWHEKTAVEVHNLVRALQGPGLPGAFTSVNGEQIIINKTQLLPEVIKGLPGRAVFKRGRGVVVIAKDRGLLVQNIRKWKNPSIELELSVLLQAGCLE